MSSNTKSHSPWGSTAPRATKVVCSCRSGPNSTKVCWVLVSISNDCCQWSSERCCSDANSWKCSMTCRPNTCRPSMSVSALPRCTAKGNCKMRVAPGLIDKICPCVSSNTTPAVRLSSMVCKWLRAKLTCAMLDSTVRRACASCSVICAKARVRPSNSSLPCKTARGLKSPAATSRTPSASSNKGRAS